jgi:hypothetical protein
MRRSIARVWEEGDGVDDRPSAGNVEVVRQGRTPHVPTTFGDRGSQARDRSMFTALVSRYVRRNAG